jgi:nucleoside-diphosphate-sugar epimerase
MSEWLAERYKLQAKIVRVYSVVGEEMPLNGQYALGRFIWQAIFDKEVRYYGGASVRSYIHVDEAAEQILAVLNDFNGLAPIDIGSSVPVSISELAHMVSRLYNVPCKSIPATDDQRPANIYIPSNGCIPKITLEESLRRVREYIRG